MLLQKAESFSDYVKDYRNNLENNDRIWTDFTIKTDEHPLLKEHRDYVEQNKLGFGDRAFHYMWFLLFRELKKKQQKVKALEIGVYKGQVISLWSLLSRELNIQAEISAVSPLKGNVPTNRLLNNKYINKLKLIFSPTYRENQKLGNSYRMDNYKEIIKSLFNRFNLSFDAVRLYQGYSTDPKVLSAIKDQSFNLIYIDGDHSYEGVIHDLKNYSGLLEKNGYLVMDDASCEIEGSKFWKGHKEVSRACAIIEDLGFRNILNVGHNRVYQRI